MDNIKTINDLKRLATLDVVRFTTFPNNEKYDSWYEISYNSKYSNIRDEFFGGHTLIITLFVKNNKLVDHESELAG